MKRNTLINCLFGCVLVGSILTSVHFASAATPGSGKTETNPTFAYTIDPNHSSVTFRIRHMVSVVKGSFRKFGGQINFDPKFQESTVDVMIDADSIDTNQEKRDEHLKSPDFFDVKKFPNIKFHSKRMTRQSIVGDLTLCGVTKEVTLDYVFHGIANDLEGHKRIGFSATTSINRADFGILYNKQLTPDLKLLGDEVPIEIEIQAIEKPLDNFQNSKKTADKSSTVKL